ncbi:glycosyltransferase [Olivibacter sp. SDN3]|uniref:glycosyltransferase n=1 Tax=Olivibacter sp. SDN3 TaxID=2764720 RepID=UPI00165111B5|nr:glycosyltransferase [Olivibacter sp. SDN3]QNL47786.1 glycosyltransferase [Olivibacter sp. SDN3]
MYYYLLVYRRLRNYNVRGLLSDIDLPPLSVIVCARNEEANLRLYLTEVLEQDYPLYEVIVVNDCSSDDSNWILKEFKQRYKHLRVVDISEHARYKHGKKFAVTLGVKAAQHEHLVFTDADCYPASNQWLQYMAQEFVGSVEIVLGYSPYLSMRGFLNKYIRFETYYTAQNYLSYALKRNAYMGVGRNLAYKKSLFFKGKGFASHMHIPSGDDDLFVNQNATKENVAICIHPDAMTWSKPKTTYAAYQRQKQRHFGAGKAYRSKHKRMITLQVLSVLFFYALAVLLLVFQPTYWPIVTGIYILRLIAQFLICIPIMKKMQVGNLTGWLPLMEIYHLLYVSFMGATALFRKNVTWK